MRNPSPAVREPDAPQIPLAEYESRLVYSLLRAAIGLARRARLSIKTLQELVALNYFERLRAEGTTLQGIAGIFGKTLRTVASLSQRAKTNFFSPETAHTIPRRIEYYLYKRALTVAQLLELMPDCSAAEVADALELLEADGRVQSDSEGLYVVSSSTANLLGDNVASRIDGLNNFVDAVGDLVQGRFLDSEPDSVARVLTFRADPKRIGALKSELLSVIVNYCTLVEEVSADDDPAFYLLYGITPVKEGKVS